MKNQGVHVAVHVFHCQFPYFFNIFTRLVTNITRLVTNITRLVTNITRLITNITRLATNRRHHGQVVRALDFESGGREFESRSDH